MKFYLWKYETPFGETEAIMMMTSQGNIIGVSVDEGNIDYVDYLAWVAEGNTPEAWNPDAITEPVVEPEPTTESDTTTESVES